MDGPHDLGGKEGFGPVDTAAPPFRHDWERMQWALSQTLPVRGGGIDWWRHGIERLDWGDYLTFPYFAKWNANEYAQAVFFGLLTLEEASDGRPRGAPADPPPPQDVEAVLATMRTRNADFSRPAAAPARFAPGDRVRTRRHGHPGHTRLPAYARATTGTVIAAHGGFLFADAGGDREERVEHLYTVAIAAPDLWGEGAHPDDSVHLDLWEPYLDPA